MKKFQGSVGSVQRELQEALEAKNEIMKQMKEMEKRLRLSENNVNQLTDDLSQSERIKRAISSEKDEALEEIASLTMARDSAIAEKKRMESNVASLNMDYEEMQLLLSESEVKHKKTLAQLEQSQNDLNNERQNSSRFENQKTIAERAVNIRNGHCAIDTDPQLTITE